MRSGLASLYVSISLAMAFSLSANAASNCTLAQVADWPVLSSRGVPIVEGSVDGQKVGIALDTGGVTMMFRPSADRLGLTRHVAPGYRVFGVGGETYVESTEVDEFKIGALVRKNWQVMVAGERTLGSGVDLLLGEDVFDKVDVEFDLPHNRVRLFQPKDCDGVGLAYWSAQTASVVDMDSESRIVVPVKINGQAMEAQLDSGPGTSVLDKSVAERLGLTTDAPGVAPAGKSGGLGAKSVDYFTARVQSFEIGGETINIRFADLWKDATTTPIGSHVPEKFGLTPALLLGSDFLRAHRVFVSHSQRKMYFTYEGGPVFQPEPRGDSASRA
jgi:predicted aspartyl protease